jgi:hypothetical protein
MTAIPTITTRIVSRRLNDESPRPVKTDLGTKVRHSDGYLAKVIQLELARAKRAWSIYQSTRDRDGVYIYLQAVFDLVSKWREQGDATATTCRAFERANPNRQLPAEPFAAAIFCTSDPEKVDGRTRSKWSRVLRYMVGSKKKIGPLKKFIKRHGGINECASQFAARLGRDNLQIAQPSRIGGQCAI